MRNLIFSILMVIISLNISAQIADKAENVSPLLVGETIPLLMLKNSDGNAVDLKKLTSEKPSVLIFYRGGWCPYCNLHLAEVGKVEAEILKLGYQIIAISPDAPASLNATGEKNELKYTLLSDSDGSLMKTMGLAFQAPERSVKYIDKGSEGANKEFLPVPALIVIDTKGVIVFEHISPNYTKRMSSKLLLAVLENVM